MKTVFITLAIAAIVAQIPHAYVAIIWNSHIKMQWLKVIQAMAFCLFVSIAIMAFVIQGFHGLAFAGAVTEIIVNVYYYSTHQRERLWVDKIKKNWFQYFLAVLLPALIYIFSITITLV